MPAASTTGDRAKPFLKWVGGKRQVLKWMRDLYPPRWGNYFEPFVGGGAVFFDLNPPKAVLSDTNRELIDCYKVVRDRVSRLITALDEHVYDKDHYYKVRELDPYSLDPVERAARMIFMNRTGYNGLYRVNSKGKFNVPFGRYVNPRICDRDTLKTCSRRLKGVKILRASFESVLDRAGRGDFVYFDPPYIPLSRTANFTAYQKRGFGMENQERLAEVFDELKARGANVMLSNSDVEWVHDRYRGNKIAVVKAARQVNSDKSRRGPVGEVVITSY